MRKPTIDRCPVCETKLNYIGSSRTAVNYRGYAPPHDHDDNCQLLMLICENGHEISERQQNTCLVEGCNWKGKTECFCSPLGIRVYDPVKKEVVYVSNPGETASV